MKSLLFICISSAEEILYCTPKRGAGIFYNSSNTDGHIGRETLLNLMTSMITGS